MSELFVRRETGFTLFEVIVVMALITLLAAASIISLAFYIPNLHLKTTAQDINIQIQKARLEGIRRSKTIAVRFFSTDISGAQKYGPIIWVDDNYDSTNAAHPLLESGEEVLYRLPIDEYDVDKWEASASKSVRFNHDVDNDGVDDVDTDGVVLSDNSFVLNSRGISNKPGSVYLVNTRGKTKQVMITLGGAVRVY